jgi:hypothetical protein
MEDETDTEDLIFDIISLNTPKIKKEKKVKAAKSKSSKGSVRATTYPGSFSCPVFITHSTPSGQRGFGVERSVGIHDGGRVSQLTNNRGTRASRPRTNRSRRGRDRTTPLSSGGINR